MGYAGDSRVPRSVAQSPAAVHSLPLPLLQLRYYDSTEKTRFAMRRQPRRQGAHPVLLWTRLTDRSGPELAVFPRCAEARRPYQFLPLDHPG